MFDRSLLPPARLEFVVMADTHYMLDAATTQVGGAQEFSSRSSQTVRVERALQLVASLGLPVIHLGDIVQEFPERPGFQQSMDEATAQIARWGLTPYQVAGNHDVGDKPDPTMPTDWVTAESLAAYHARFGRSWYSFDLGPIHGIVLNAQLFNASLPEAEQQRQWLQDDLAGRHGRQLAIFLHIPLYLRDQDESALGHYDNIDQPDRRWLLDLIQQHQVGLVFAGHSHYAFFNRLGETRLFIAASTTFTRPGFGELFSSAPPPDRGRDDTPKLGFYLLRLVGDELRIHFQRTAGEIGAQPDDARRQRLVTRLPADLPASPLGVCLRHTLATQLEVPAAWPSVVRQPVRNEYPLLTTLELGARRVFVPVTDLDDSFQRERLTVLHDEGVEITAWALWHHGLTPPMEQIAQHRDLLDGLTIHQLNERWPDSACLDDLARLRAALGAKRATLTLSVIVAREQVPGKQHDRSRHGYRPDELSELDRRLAAQGGAVEGAVRALCRVAPNQSPWDAILSVAPGELRQIDGLDWLVELSTEDDDAHLVRVTEALFAVAATPGSRLLIDPLADLDRTMDTFHGLLDRRSNPRTPFHAARALNTLLFATPHQWTAATVRPAGLDGWLARRLQSTAGARWLLVPATGYPAADEVVTLPCGPLRLLRLHDATVITLQPGASLAAQLAENGPSVLWPDTASPLMV